jgi:hypothetical protein
MIGCGLLSVSLLILVLLGVVEFELESGWVVTVMVDEGRTERLVLDERVLKIIDGNIPTDQSC